jgi:hypothetical protein
MSTVRKLGVIAAVVLVLSLSACTSSTAPALTRAANAAKAAAAAPTHARWFSAPETTARCLSVDQG